MALTISRVAQVFKRLDRWREVLRCQQEFADSSTITRAYLGLGSMPMPAIVRHISGLQFRVLELTDVEAIWQIFLRRVYEVRPEDRVIVDAGANIGAFSLYASWRAPQAQILAIEPFPSTFERLQAHIADNGLSERITAIGCALAAVPGEVVMAANVNIGNQGNYIVTENSPVAATKRVKSVTLIDAMAGLPKQIDLLKMDIEGSEYDVLLNLPPETLSRFRRINLEHHDPLQSKAKLIAHLTAAGFNVRQFAGGVDSMYGILHCDRAN